jgi:hypothetical protein
LEKKLEIFFGNFFLEIFFGGFIFYFLCANAERSGAASELCLILFLDLFVYLPFSKFDNIFFIAGETAAFSCATDMNIPGLTATWLRDNKPLGDAAADRFKVVAKENVFKLEISSCKDEDKGQYTCRVTNAGGEVATCSAQLEVHQRKSLKKLLLESGDVVYSVLSIFLHLFFSFCRREEGEGGFQPPRLPG